MPQPKQEPEPKVLSIRKGINGFAYSVCTEDGHWIMNADSQEQIREYYSGDVKRKAVRLRKQTRLFPVDADDHKPVSRTNRTTDRTAEGIE